MSIFVNAPLKLVILNLLIKSIRSLIRALLIGKNETLLWFRAHVFIAKNLKHLIVHRLYRLKIYRDRDVLKKLIDKCI